MIIFSLSPSLQNISYEHVLKPKSGTSLLTQTLNYTVQQTKADGQTCIFNQVLSVTAHDKSYREASLAVKRIPTHEGEDND